MKNDARMFRDEVVKKLLEGYLLPPQSDLNIDAFTDETASDATVLAVLRYWKARHFPLCEAVVHGLLNAEEEIVC